MQGLLPPEGYALLAQWRPGLLLPVIVAYVYYVLVLYWLARRLPAAEPPRRGALAAFGLALLAGFLAHGSPLHLVAEAYLFSAHMVQHLLLTMALPPLLLLGLPEWFAARLFGGRLLGAVVRTASRPVVAFLAYNFVLALYHMPVVYEAGLRHPWLHFGQHALLVTTGLMMWWPVYAPIKAQRLHDGLQALYLFAHMVLQMAIHTMITFAEEPLYAWYVGAPRHFGLTPLEDQVLGGFIMYVGGTFVYFAVMVAALVRWMRSELRRFPLEEEPPGEETSRA